MPIEQSKRFFFYQSAIGDLERIVLRNVISDIKPTPGFLTNAFGVKVSPKHLPLILGENEGVEPPPIPANWHADLAEFGAAIFAVEAAQQKFTVVELGCGWGCWLNITGAVAKNKGLEVLLIGVEGDAGHVSFAYQALKENGFSEHEYIIHHGIASSRSGQALFPIQEKSGASWGLEAVFDVDDEKAEELLSTGSYSRLEQIELSEILPQGCDRIDLLHVDIQGAEIPLIPDSIDFLNEKVATVLIGTHSKYIEAALFECFQKAGWSLEVERPAILSVGYDIRTQVDGVQLWRNPNLLPDKTMPLGGGEDYAGKLSIKSSPQNVKAGISFSIDVEIENYSTKSWINKESEPVNVSYHWRDTSENIVVYDGIRTCLVVDILDSGEVCFQSVNVVSPDKPGKYRLEVTLVHESVSWFENGAFISAQMDIIVD